MTERLPRERYPWWVRLTMLGAASRRSLLFWAALYTVSALASVVIGLWLEEDLTYAALFGAVFVVLAAAHWLTVLWIDRNGTWKA